MNNLLHFGSHSGNIVINGIRSNMSLLIEQTFLHSALKVRVLSCLREPVGSDIPSAHRFEHYSLLIATFVHVKLCWMRFFLHVDIAGYRLHAELAPYDSSMLVIAGRPIMFVAYAWPHIAVNLRMIES